MVVLKSMPYKHLSGYQYRYMTHEPAAKDLPSIEYDTWQMMNKENTKRIAQKKQADSTDNVHVI